MAKNAKESKAIQKARQKLKKQFDEENRLINEKALSRMRQAIEIYIKRHADERISLKSKEISLFDENKHPAKVKSQYVLHLIHDLKHEIEEGRELNKRVKGKPE
ncbi:MAG: hypothetical protein WDZ27_03200 [Waddliaceae bacterium]